MQSDQYFSDRGDVLSSTCSRRSQLPAEAHVGQQQVVGGFIVDFYSFRRMLNAPAESDARPLVFTGPWMQFK